MSRFLNRMRPVGVLLAGAFVAGLPMASAQAADQWSVNADESSVEFSGTQLGAEFDGQFRKFSADIVFSPDDLAGSKVNVLIDIASVDSESADRDAQIISPDFFDVGQWPTAKFTSKSFREVAPGKYEVVADLTMRDVTREVVMPFDLEISGNTAEAEGDVTIKRTDFGVGQGQWADVSEVGDEVSIHIDIEAIRP